MNDEQKEALLARTMEDLKVKASDVINNVMRDVYTDYLPYVLSDAESNLSNRVQGVIQNVIEGKYKKTDYGNILVDDGYGFSHLIQVANEHHSAPKALIDQMGEEIKGARIKQLEAQVRSLIESRKFM